ncbi:MAG: CBS domain-containing protein [Desulfobulbus sp.]|nr:CBS domain-containing protein [Desulfobulbus sp.]
MNTMPIIKDLIIPLEEYPHVRANAMVHDAVGALFTHVDANGRLKYDELLVINRDFQYVGRLTLRNILTCYFPSLFVDRKRSFFYGKPIYFSELAILMEDSFQQECKRQGEQQVRGFMQPPIESIEARLHPLHAAEVMVDQRLNSLPVVENDTVIGVILLVDVFQALASRCSL